MEIYAVTRIAPKTHQMTLDELWSLNEYSYVVPSTTVTRTYKMDENNASWYWTKQFSPRLLSRLEEFNKKWERIINIEDKQSLYRTFHIPKKSGGLRRIDAPNEELMEALNELKKIFEVDFRVLYHTSAYAYVKGRSTLDCVRYHQHNQSKWFLKLDFHDFFGSTTPDFVTKQFRRVFPFNYLLNTAYGTAVFEKAMSLCFLHGGLPQGTPISPIITNTMMIPIDFELANGLRHYKKSDYAYTRYADDIIISNKYNFHWRDIQNKVVSIVKEFDAPFELNLKKTRYGSSSGANWNLGVMLNRDNEITVGHKKKKLFYNMCHNYLADRLNGVRWSLNDIQVLQGLYSYYRSVETDTMDRIILYINEKHNSNILEYWKADIRSYMSATA